MLENCTSECLQMQDGTGILQSQNAQSREQTLFQSARKKLFSSKS